MRRDWIPFSASALVVGAMALVLATVANPSQSGQTVTDMLHVAQREGSRWLMMSVMYFLASVGLALGLPALLSLFSRRGHRTGVVGVAVLLVGVMGTSGLSMLTVFLRALATSHAVRPAALEQVTDDRGLVIALYGWVLSFYCGILVVAVALMLARNTPRWVPLLLLVFLIGLPVGSNLGRLAQAIQVLLLAVAFTGVAISAVSEERRDELRREALR